VYLVFWGREWSDTFTTADANGSYSSTAAQRYIELFVDGLGGSTLAGVQTQYCDGVASGSVSCPRGSGRVGNPRSLLRGVWVDPSPLPAEQGNGGVVATSSGDPVGDEATAAASHFGFDADGVYVVLTPTGHFLYSYYGSGYCAFHESVALGDGRTVNAAFVPYVMDKGSSCGGYSVYTAPDAFGHGYFDGYSVVTVHEIAETETDPVRSGLAAPLDNGGWFDNAQGEEDGDRCTWLDRAVALRSGSFAVQALWSNEANAGSGGCALSRGRGPSPAPQLVSLP
jgi:serine protease